MRKKLVEDHINSLRASFGPVKVPIAEERLRVLYDAKDYGQMIGVIQKTLCLDMRVFMALVNSGGPKNAPAWIHKPGVVPMINTSSFRQYSVILYLRKSFLAEAPFETAVMAIAHELSHVVLDAVRHPLRTEEEAVDLTAMLLGFRDFFVTGRRVIREVTSPVTGSSIDDKVYEIGDYGYLSAEESWHAVEYMTFR